MEAEVKKILNEEQYTRYQQLSLQQQGPPALARPEIAKEVGLSEAQQNQIRQIQQAQQEAMRSMMQGGGGGDRQAMMEQMQAMREETNKKILAVLNAEQRAKWDSMLGKPFNFGQGRGG
jgi:alpha-mannosidase